MSVGFANGRAVVEDAVRHAQALAWFRAEPGYTVVELTPADSEPAPEPEPQPGPESSEEATDVDATPDTEGDTPEAPAAPAARRGK
ncbi:hypothetical protein [Streptomyces subrutilus]|uniref:hypothetical protein n=1 Tax=Streptomyces subrutilus TaxID=36818 RepID=UPI002E11EFFC|nr:hypothetical protein OG479_32980 [Streptomyces subrutilus]